MAGGSEPKDARRSCRPDPNSWRRFPKPPRGRYCFQRMCNGFLDRCGYELKLRWDSTLGFYLATIGNRRSGREEYTRAPCAPR